MRIIVSRAKRVETLCLLKRIFQSRISLFSFTPPPHFNAVAATKSIGYSYSPSFSWHKDYPVGVPGKSCQIDPDSFPHGKVFITSDCKRKCRCKKDTKHCEPLCPVTAPPVCSHDEEMLATTKFYAKKRCSCIRWRCEPKRKYKENRLTSAKSFKMRLVPLIVRHRPLTVRHKAPTIRHRPLTLLHRPLAVRHGKALEIRHKSLTIHHRTLTIRHKALTIRQKALTIRHKVLTIRHKSLTIRHKALTIRHKVVK